MDVPSIESFVRGFLLADTQSEAPAGTVPTAPS